MTFLLIAALVALVLFVAWVVVILIGVALTFRSCRRHERELDARVATQWRSKGRW